MDYPKKAECIDWLFIETKSDIKIRRNNTTIHINFLCRSNANVRTEKR